jgi:hypothetical protein
MRLLERLLQHTCSHRFSWPRIDAFGRDYQICLDCGTAYEYDWKGMRRTGRLHSLPSVAATANDSDKSTRWSWR